MFAVWPDDNNALLSGILLKNMAIKHRQLLSAEMRKQTNAQVWAVSEWVVIGSDSVDSRSVD
jgi:hypothetical protein